MNQSEFEANACNWRQARENACGQVMIGFGLGYRLWFRFSLVEKVARILLTNHRAQESKTKAITKLLSALN